MRQSLQSKFNLLGLLLIAFFLLMLPMFTQVKNDTRDSLKEAKNTSLYKFSRELAKDFKPPEDLENTQVEDYWDDYQEQARDANPDCPACNPEADADGDNMTNKEEVEQGRNPLCHEEQYGVEYCQNADPNNLTDPDDVLDRVPRVFLHNITFTTQTNCTNPAAPSIFGGVCATWDFQVTSNFTKIEAFLNYTGVEGANWNIQMVSSEDGQYAEDGAWSGSRSALTGGGSPPRGSARAEILPTVPGEHRADLTLSGDPATGSQGTWYIEVYGIR